MYKYKATSWVSMWSEAPPLQYAFNAQKATNKYLLYDFGIICSDVCMCVVVWHV